MPRPHSHNGSETSPLLLEAGLLQPYGTLDRPSTPSDDFSLLLDLPAELLPIIYQFLTPEEMAKLSATCRSMFQLAEFPAKQKFFLQNIKKFLNREHIALELGLRHNLIFEQHCNETLSFLFSLFGKDYFLAILKQLIPKVSLLQDHANLEMKEWLHENIGVCLKPGDLVRLTNEIEHFDSDIIFDPGYLEFFSQRLIMKMKSSETKQGFTKLTLYMRRLIILGTQLQKHNPSGQHTAMMLYLGRYKKEDRCTVATNGFDTTALPKRLILATLSFVLSILFIFFLTVIGATNSKLLFHGSSSMTVLCMLLLLILFYLSTYLLNYYYKNFVYKYFPPIASPGFVHYNLAQQELDIKSPYEEIVSKGSQDFVGSIQENTQFLKKKFSNTPVLYGLLRHLNREVQQMPSKLKILALVHHTLNERIQRTNYSRINTRTEDKHIDMVRKLGNSLSQINELPLDEEQGLQLLKNNIELI